MPAKTGRTRQLAFRLEHDLVRWLSAEVDRVKASFPEASVSIASVVRGLISKAYSEHREAIEAARARETREERVSRWAADGTTLVCVLKPTSKQKIRLLSFDGVEVTYQVEGKERVRHALAATILSHYREATP